MSSSHAGTEAEQLLEATDADAERIQEVFDAQNNLQSPRKHASKSSKTKKRPTDRKRKGSSWYNVSFFTAAL